MAEQESGAGRPAVLGIDFGGTKIALGACDPAGLRLAAAELETQAWRGGADTVRRGIAAGRSLLAGIEDVRLAAVGVCTFGIPDDRGVALAPAVSVWA